MFKKALILCLAICMLSVSAFAGTQTLSLEGDYAETTGGPVAGAKENAVPDTVYVNTAADGSQTITLYPAGSSQQGTKTNLNTTNGTFGGNKWFLVKMPLRGMISVENFVFNTKMRYNSGATFYISALESEVWETAVASLTDNTKTLASDSALAVPSGEVLFSQKLGVTAETTYELTSAELTEYVDSVAKARSEYAYFAVYFSTNRSVNDGCSFVVNFTNADLEGMKPIRGLSASLVGIKTETLYFNNSSEIAYVTSSTPDTNNFDSANGNYQMTSETSGATDLAVMYLKKDLSAFMDKEIISVKLAGECRVNSGANTLKISRTKSDWISYGEGEISFNNQPLTDSSVSEQSYDKQINNTPLDREFDVTALTEGLTGGVLSLRVRCLLGSGKTGYGIQFNDVNENSGAATRLIITYKDDIAFSEATGNEFTYTATIETEGAIARMIVGVFGENDAFLGAIASDVLTSDGTTPLELDINLSEYPDAATVRAYLWNGDTLVPYFTPIVRNVAVGE